MVVSHVEMLILFEISSSIVVFGVLYSPLYLVILDYILWLCLVKHVQGLLKVLTTSFLSIVIDLLIRVTVIIHLSLMLEVADPGVKTDLSVLIKWKT